MGSSPDRGRHHATRATRSARGAGRAVAANGRRWRVPTAVGWRTGLKELHWFAEDDGIHLAEGQVREGLLQRAVPRTGDGLAHEGRRVALHVCHQMQNEVEPEQPGGGPGGSGRREGGAAIGC